MPRAVAVAAIALWLGACATGERAGSPPATGAPRAPAVTAAAPPEWRPGDQWTLQWTTPSGSGTRTAEVVEARPLGGQQYYVLRIGDVDHLYTRELHMAGTLRNEAVESRSQPPVPLLTWPLEPGRKWNHRGVYEERGSRRDVADAFTVAGREKIATPAGSFNTVKVVRQGATGDTDEYWYAPELKFYAKWVGRRGNAQFEEHLVSYRLVGGDGTRGSSSPPPGSTTPQRPSGGPPGAPKAPSSSGPSAAPPAAPLSGPTSAPR